MADDASHDIDMVQILHREHVPDAAGYGAAGGVVGMGILHLGVPFKMEGIPSGDHVYHTVVGMPGVIQREGGDTAGDPLTSGAFHPGGAGRAVILRHGETEGQQIGLHIQLRERDPARRGGGVAVDGEIVDIAAYLHLGVKRHGSRDAHVVDRVVIVTVEIRGDDAGHHADGGLVVSFIEPVLIQHGIHHAGQRGVDAVERIEEEPGTDDGADGVGVDKGASVVGRGHRGDGMDPAVVAARKQGADGLSGSTGGIPFLRRSVVQKIHEPADGDTAEGVPDEIDGMGAVPVEVGDQAVSGEVPSVAVMAAAPGVGDAVVGPGAGDLRVQLTGPVPAAGEGADGCGIAGMAFSGQLVDDTAGMAAPVGQDIVDFVIASEAV